ncbi:MlaE family ABC transporter permease [Undibacterium sp. Ji67W]|uniref:MlaE family ABC transporter permease n=1 Tax=Undibacterium sp. Ji67W TaxID=3413042 RepID=UPI003BF23110
MINTTEARIEQTAPGLLHLSGCWTVCHLGSALSELDQLFVLPLTHLSLDGKKIMKIDSMVVWVLQMRLQKLIAKGTQINMLDWPPAYQLLLDNLPLNSRPTIYPAVKSGTLEIIGKESFSICKNSLSLLSFVGETTVDLLNVLRHPGQARGRSVLRNLQISGANAVPIIGITSFLLGIVIAYQGADQLRHYGANIFVVELVGYAMLREFSPLITAIIVAGRSGSAYAAQIGTMQVTEEIDALNTIGIKPIELLVLPKLIALLIALPLLTLFADLLGVLGGMWMASSKLQVSPHEFLLRFGTEIPLKTLFIGLGKSWVFAFVIVLIGCFQGFHTKTNADSVGQQTTHSVVQSIFIVIVLDAVFSIVFNLLDL